MAHAAPLSGLPLNRPVRARAPLTPAFSLPAPVLFNLNRTRSAACCRQRKPPACLFRRPVDRSKFPLLEVRDISYTVPTDSRLRLLRKVNLTVHDNELVLVIGENGSGKSTLLSVIVGFLNPQHGKVLIRGEHLRGRKRIAKVGMVMQNPGACFLGRSVLEEIIVGYNDATPDDVRSVLFEVGLGSVSLLKRPDDLSGGQKKRLALAVQLMRTRVADEKPELLLLDEPMAGVDAAGRLQLAGVVRSLAQRFAVLVISHEPAELLEYADRVIQLAGGELYEVDKSIIDRAIEINAKRARQEKLQRKEALP